jgi:hypothetical protein
MGYRLHTETGERHEIEPGHLRPIQDCTSFALRDFLRSLVRTFVGLPIDLEDELAEVHRRAWQVDLHRAWGEWVRGWWLEERVKGGDRRRDPAADIAAE